MQQNYCYQCCLADICKHIDQGTHTLDSPACDSFDPGMRWIPVTERLPEICENVIVYVVYHSSRQVNIIRSVVPAYYTEDGFWMYGNGIRLQNATHWMPLPEPPADEKEE